MFRYLDAWLGFKTEHPLCWLFETHIFQLLFRKLYEMVHYKLVIGNRNYSSWSLRVWLHATLTLQDTKEDTLEVVRIPLYLDDYKKKIHEYSPAGRVPILIVKESASSVDNIATVWDSLAIMEYLSDEHDGKLGWPQSLAEKAMARSIACEFHSGFLSIRDELPQNCKRIGQKPPIVNISESCRRQIARVDEIWSTCYNQNPKGPWFFGERITIADIMYIPVALRFLAYGIEVSPKGRRFIQATEELPLVQQWIEAANSEPEALNFVDELIPAAQSPLVL